MKEKIFISYYEDDGQVDVEVYKWDEETQEKGEFIRELAEYAFNSRFEAQEHIDKLKTMYIVVQEESQNEEEAEYAKYKEEIEKVILEDFKVTHQTYVIEADKFEERVNLFLSKKMGYPVKVNMTCPDKDFSHYVSIDVTTDDNPEWVVQNIKSYYEKKRGYPFVYDNEGEVSIEKEVVEDLFNSNQADVYWHTRDNKVIVSVPL